MVDIPRFIGLEDGDEALAFELSVNHVDREGTVRLGGTDVFRATDLPSGRHSEALDELVERFAKRLYAVLMAPEGTAPK